MPLFIMLKLNTKQLVNCVETENETQVSTEQFSQADSTKVPSRGPNYVF